jgi:hypothetical protein
MHLHKATLAMAACIFFSGSTALTGVKTAHAEPLSCDAIEALADDSQSLIEQFNLAGYAGYEKKYRRKTFVIHQLADIIPDECNAYLEFDVTLKRPWRRDAHGTMVVHGTLSANPEGDMLKVCLSNAEVIDLVLSNTAWVGEQFYEVVSRLEPPVLEKCAYVPQQ